MYKFIVLACFLPFLPTSSTLYTQPPGPLAPKEYAQKIVTEHWDSSQWKHFDDLIKEESEWDSNAQNPNSSAYGLGQFLSSTWETVGCKKTPDPYIQLDCTVKYIAKEYETPAEALRFQLANDWY